MRPWPGRTWPGPGLPGQLEGAADNSQQFRHGRRGQGCCRVTEHRDHHEGLARAVGGQEAQGQHARLGAALVPDRGPLRRVKLGAAVVGRQDRTEWCQRGLGRELLQSGKQARLTLLTVA